MDPLSEVLSLLKPRSCDVLRRGCRWEVGDPVPGPEQAHQVLRRGVRRMLAGDRRRCRPRLSEDGRLLRAAKRTPFSSRASDLALAPEPSSKYFPPPRPGAVVTINGGGDFFLVGSRFGVSGGNVDRLMGMLPPIVHIQNGTEQAALRWSVERMMQELHEPEPGGFLIAQHLAHMMLVQALRLYVKAGQANGRGWLFGVVDRQLGPAIGAVHADPSYRWTLQGAGRARLHVALGIRTEVQADDGRLADGVRDALAHAAAGDRLENSGDPVSVISLALGYESESAFSTAFKRVMGSSPRQYGRHSKPAPDGPATSPGGSSQANGMLSVARNQPP